MQRSVRVAAVAAACVLVSQCDYTGGFLGGLQGNMTVSETTLTFSATLAGAQPAGQSIDITNAGGVPLDWTLQIDYVGTPPAWLNASDTSGNISAGGSATLTISASMTGLSADTYAATITISSPGNAPVVINVTFTVSPAPSPPSITSAAVTAAAVGVAYSYQVTATGSPAPTFDIDTAASDAGLSINATTGLLTWTPSAAGSQAVTVTATNSEGNDTQNFTITVSAAPVAPTITSTPVTSVSVGAPYSYQVTASGTPAPTFAIDAAASTAGLSINTATGLLTWTPSTAGDQAVTVTATNSAGSDAQDFTIVVTDTGNTPPSATDDTDTVVEDSADNVIDVLANDTDADVGDTLTVIDVTQPSHGTVVIGTGGANVEYTPDADFAGSDSFTYTVSDATDTDTATVVVTVTNTNDDPTAAADTATVPEDNGATAIDVLANDSFAPDTGETLTVTAVTQGTNGAVAITSGGSGLTYEPDTDYVGGDTFTYTISDGNGGTDTATVTVTVTNVNDDPTATDDTATVAEDAPATSITVLANDSFAPDTGETLTVTSVTVPPHGTASHDGTSVSYAPDPDYNGSDTFDYTISDGNGGSATATVTVTITSVNDDPTAVGDTASVDEDSPGTIIDVLANDTDVDAGDTLTITTVTDPANGTATTDGATVTYAPDSGFSGDDTFAYTISDGNGGTATATVTVEVSPDATAPGSLGTLTASYTGVTDTVLLSWTATGDDGASGTAAYYVVKTSSSPITDDTTFGAATTFDQAWVPGASGDPESAVLDVAWYYADRYVAIRAYDSSGNAGPISSMFLELDPATTPVPSLPATYDFGNVPVNTTASHTFGVTCDPASLVDLVISNVTTLDASAFIVTAGATTPVTVPPGDTHLITVSVTLTTPGSVTDTLRVSHNGADGSPISDASVLTANGVNYAPCIDGYSLPSPVPSGSNVTLDVFVTDLNNVYPSIVDIGSVTVDLTALGGANAEPLTAAGSLDVDTGEFTIVITTGGLPTGAYDLEIAAMDMQGVVDRQTVTLVLYTGGLLVVDPTNSPPDYMTIQEAIDATADGDLVLVRDGTYSGFDNTNLSWSGRDIIVMSENGPATTIIDCQDSGRAFLFNDGGQSNATLVSGFTMTAGAASAVRLVSLSSPLLPRFTNCVFDSNTNSTQGGAVYIDGAFAAPEFQDCTFIGNTVDDTTYSGGAVYGINNPHAAFVDCSFSNNVARYGSAIHMTSSSYLTLDTCLFDNNIAQEVEYGGAVVLDNCTTTVTYSDFTGNNGQFGGAFYVNGGQLDITDSTFDSNTGYVGGAIYTLNSAIVTIQGGSFTLNSASSAGAINGDDISLQNVTFSCNAATGYGGAFYGRDAWFSQCYFDNNSAGSYGGAVYCYGTVSECNFISNESTGASGGAVASMGAGFSGFADVFLCMFDSNHANYTGGAFYGHGNVEQSSFTDNDAGRQGSAISHVGGGSGALDVIGCTFSGNFTTENGTGYGGTVYLNDTASAVVSDSIFDGNSSAADAGAILITQPNAMVSNCLVVNNNAVGMGGGIVVAAGSPVIPTWIEFTTVADNLASQGGGICFTGGVSSTSDSIVYFNQAMGAGNEVSVDPAGAPYVGIDFCDIDVSEPQDIDDPSMLMNGTGFFPPDAYGNISLPPLFLTGMWGDYYLEQPLSPCVDTGSGDVVIYGMDLYTTDPLGTLDVGIVDMGYHYYP